MRTLTVADAARDFRAVLSGVELSQKEVVLIRAKRKIARLVPEPPALNALEVFGDLAGSVDATTGETLAKAVGKARNGRRGTLGELRDPWAS